MATASDTAEKPVSIDIDIEDGRTTVVVSGSTEVAVVVRSESGERVYLPPERTPDDDGATTPYEPSAKRNSPYEGIPADSPYTGIPSDSPYAPMRQSPDELGLTRTANGFRIVHPEPVTDVRILR